MVLLHNISIKAFGNKSPSPESFCFVDWSLVFFFGCWGKLQIQTNLLFLFLILSFLYLFSIRKHLFLFHNQNFDLDLTNFD